MPKLSDLMSLSALDTAIADGYISKKTHPSAPLAVLNYSNKTQYEQSWDNVTEQCRGLIYNTTTDEIVARPWRKFHNFDDARQPYPPAGPMILSNKFDGSMMTAYWPNDNRLAPAMASRGSFTSDQALFGTELFDKLVRELPEDDQLHLIGDMSSPYYTYLFELIVPWNRIVCDYGNDERLVLLDVLNNQTGRADLARFDSLPWPDKAEKKLLPGFYDTIASDIPDGDEGFVLYWPHHDRRVKVKAAAYVELHRIVTGLSKKTIWEALGRGQTADQIKANLPDELFEFVDQTVLELRKKQLEVLDQVTDAWWQVSGGDSVAALTRKQFAERAKKHGPIAKYLFKILDGSSEEQLKQLIWETLKPVGDTRAFARGEDVS